MVELGGPLMPHTRGGRTCRRLARAACGEDGATATHAGQHSWRGGVLAAAPGQAVAAEESVSLRPAAIGAATGRHQQVEAERQHSRLASKPSPWCSQQLCLQQRRKQRRRLGAALQQRDVAARRGAQGTQGGETCCHLHGGHRVAAAGPQGHPALQALREAAGGVLRVMPVQK